MKKVVVTRLHKWHDRKFNYLLTVNDKALSIPNGEQREVFMPANASVRASIMWCGSPTLTIDSSEEKLTAIQISPNKRMHTLLLVAVAAIIALNVLANMVSHHPLLHQTCIALLLICLVALILMVTVWKNRWIDIKKIPNFEVD